MSGTAITIPIEHVLVLAGVLFARANGVVRRNVLFQLMSLEIMMNSTGLAFVAAGATGPRQTARSRACWCCRSRPPKSRLASARVAARTPLRISTSTRQMS
jgi:hypothetical protein